MDCLDRAMECHMPVQCLIFFVDDTQSDQLEPEQGSEAMLSFSIISPGSSSSASTPLTKAFALLPGDYQRLHTHTLHTFQQNDIIILTTENMPNSLSNTENLRIMELHLDGSRRATADPLDVYHSRGCDHLVKRLFLNSTIRITHIKYKHNNPVIPAIDDVILGVMETILGRIIGIPCTFGLGFNGHLLHLAATSGPAVLVQRLLKHGADVDGKTEEGRSSLHLAILGGGEVPLQSLQPRRPPGLNPLSNVQFQASPLPPYIRWPAYEVVEVLLESGADVESTDHELATPLILAIQYRRLDLVKLFLQYGADLKAKAGVKTVLELAYWAGPGFLSYFLERCFLDECTLKEIEAQRLLVKVYWDRFTPRGIHDAKLSINFISDEILVCHLVKIMVLREIDKLEFLDERSLWTIMRLAPKGFRTACTEELTRLKNEPCVYLNVPTYDVLGKNECVVARLLMSNPSFTQALKTTDFKLSFPIYGGILNRHFDKGHDRAWAHKHAVKSFHLLSFRFRSLPEELQEKILCLLTTRDILKLRSASQQLPEPEGQSCGTASSSRTAVPENVPIVSIS